MSTPINDQERQFLEQFVARKWRATKRQKATAILEHIRGASTQQIAQRTGITRGAVIRLLTAFKQGGLAGVGLSLPSDSALASDDKARYGTIEQTVGVCGGSARVSGTRIPVWTLVEARELGVSEAQLLLDYPELKARNLVDAWRYADLHLQEIAAEIRRNEVA